MNSERSGVERKLGHADSFRDLEVYKHCRQLSMSIFELTKQFPEEEKFSLVSQMRRSSRSIGAQIAESWGKRRYIKHFVSKLSDADSERRETMHWIGIALDCGYIDEEIHTTLLDHAEQIGKMLHSMIRKARLFTSKS